MSATEGESPKATAVIYVTDGDDDDDVIYVTNGDERPPLWHYDGTPLQVAVCENDADLVHVLAGSIKVDVNAAFRDGVQETPLQLAAHLGNADILKSLLDRVDIRVNAPHPDHGTTALHYASFCGKQDAARTLLLGGGCRIKLTTDNHLLSHGTAGNGTPLGMTTDTNMRTLFASGMDYWQRKHHVHHSWAMKQVVFTLLLVQHSFAARHQDQDQQQQQHHRQPQQQPRLPVEMWWMVCCYLRSADFDGMCTYAMW
jgi:hypothetical protein